MKSLANEIGRGLVGLAKFQNPSEQSKYTVLLLQAIASKSWPHSNLGSFVCTMQLNKSKVGDRLDAYQDVFSPAVCLLDAKIHFNSTISNAHNGARYCTADTK